ncbi:hypothetical protein D9Q98_009695 [Chlorella vulgaris]|uniref:Uncharacterized protein n=1 Tax=Chlorella vulgaris TaxID=3077 RepID=A0A9D4YSC4_CHLVU|nr:hypothetical protein D9Q98_009695 [Chlorella vulgaris]
MLQWVVFAVLAGLGHSATLPVAAPLSDATISLQGSIPNDQFGKPVHAHGGQILQEGRTFWWVGTSQKKPPSWTSTEINLYESQDLVNWRFRSVVFRWQQIQGYPGRLPYGHLLQPPPPFRIERPKILHHARRGYFVLMFHLDTPGFEVPAVGVAISRNITGPFRWVHHFFPDNNTSYDMTVWQERGTGGAADRAYLVRSCPVMRIAVSRLRPDWLATEGSLCSTTGLGAEGPAVFRHAGRHYIFASHLTGWDPNPPILHESTAGGMCSTFWRVLPQPSHGTQAGTTYDAQSHYIFTFVFEDGSELLMWMGDRWQPDGPDSIGAASYVWLPLLPRIGAPGFELVFSEGWSLRQYKGAVWDVSAQAVRFAAADAADAVAVS